MKALSLTQPWATLVAIGEKVIETRSWFTYYRGPLLIHAASAFPTAAKDLLLDRRFHQVLARAGYVFPEDLPRGAIIAVGRLVDVRQMTQDTWPSRFEAAAREHEAAYGDYQAGRFAWLLDDVRPLPAPIPCRGALGLWTPPDNAAEEGWALLAATAGRER